MITQFPSRLTYLHKSRGRSEIGDALNMVDGGDSNQTISGMIRQFFCRKDQAVLVHGHAVKHGSTIAQLTLRKHMDHKDHYYRSLVARSPHHVL